MAINAGEVEQGVATTEEPQAEGFTHAPLIAEYAKLYDLPLVVETGTGYGFTAGALAEYDHIERIITVEVDPERYYGSVLYTLQFPKVYCVLADSEQFIPDACFRLPRALWFLDAHCIDPEVPAPGQTPLLAELNAIMTREEADADVILIDDARLLGIGGGWPNLDQIERAATRGKYSMEVKDDVVRLCPR